MIQNISIDQMLELLESFSKSKKKEPKIPLIEQETGIIFNEFERTVHVWSTSKRFCKYMNKMGIKPYEEAPECKFYELDSKHQIVLKKKPAKQARCSEGSCTL